MIVVDAHQDIAYNALQYGRDYTRSAWAIRKQEGAAGALPNGLAANGLPDALLGRLAVVFATLFVEPERASFTADKKLGYSTPEQAYRQALRQLDYYRRLAGEHPQLALIRTKGELEAVLASWAPGTTLADHRVGLALLMEGADPILEPRQVEEWYEHGVRIIGPAWSETRYAGGTGRPGPLTALGRELLDVMAEFNLILDVSHMTDEGLLEALDRYAGPVIASHSNPAAFWDNHRNLADRHILRLAERGGVIGVVLYNRFMNPAWHPRASKAETPLQRVVDMIDYICQLTGSAAHAGIGTDVDGGFGAEHMPDGIDTVTDLLRIGDALRAYGFSDADVEAILGGNFLRVLGGALPV